MDVQAAEITEDKRALWIVLFIVLLDIIGFGIILPILPFLATDLGASPELVMLFIALYMVAAFISSPILGRLSDRFGRKPVMAFSLVGSVVGYLMLAYATNLWLVALSRLISGAMAGNFSAAQAYITDSTSSDDRAKYMGYFAAMMGLGYVVGPALGALFSGDSFDASSFVLPSLIAAGLCCVAFFLLLIFVEEQRSPETYLSQGSMLNFKSMYRTVRRNELALLIILCALLYNLASGLYETIAPLWARETGVIDGPKDLLPLLLTSGVSYVLVQAVLFSKLTKLFGSRALIGGGSIGVALSCYGMTLAGDLAHLGFATVAMASTACFAALIIPSLQTMIANSAQENERGLIFGVMGSVGSLGRALATLIAGVVYAQIHIHSPYFLAMAIIFFLAFCVLKLPRGKESDL